MLFFSALHLCLWGQCFYLLSPDGLLDFFADDWILCLCHLMHLTDHKSLCLMGLRQLRVMLSEVLRLLGKES